MIKLIVSDIDGTLLDNNLQYTPRLVQAVQAARAQNVHFTLATGRMFCSALPFAQDLSVSTPIINYNGALIKSPISGETMYSQPLDLEHAQKIVNLCKEHNWHIQSYVDDILYVPKINNYATMYSTMAKVPVHSQGEAFYSMHQRPDKLLIIAEPSDIADIKAKLLEHNIGNLVTLTASKSMFIECVHKDVNKGNALCKLADIMNIKIEQVMAVGDSFNDIEMLTTAGIGIAMDNSPKAVKDAAKFVTADNNDDGLAKAIEKYVLQG